MYYIHPNDPDDKCRLTYLSKEFRFGVTTNAPLDFTKKQVGYCSVQTKACYTHFDEAYAREAVEKPARELRVGLTGQVGLSCERT
ncbi:MAG: hypothetical protein DMG32_05625 [Acidobacteria bacterium]|nr:MAG: hypothetical protein DMG32_05625 [Acidobacteriota bacterium]